MFNPILQVLIKVQFIGLRTISKKKLDPIPKPMGFSF
jgi:hypothetical protein